MNVVVKQLEADKDDWRSNVVADCKMQNTLQIPKWKAATFLS